MSTNSDNTNVFSHNRYRGSQKSLRLFAKIVNKNVLKCQKTSTKLIELHEHQPTGICEISGHIHNMLASIWGSGVKVYNYGMGETL